jgi:hypothetical protein
MSDIEMFHVGENSEGEELYNLRYVKGGRSLPTPSMTKAEALAKINGEPEQEKSYKDMTKKELELFMREHSIELDRRKSKDDLLSQVDEFFED